MNTLLTETESLAAVVVATPPNCSSDLWRVAVGLSGIAVVGTALGMEIARIHVGEDVGDSYIDWSLTVPVASEVRAIAEMAGDAALHLFGIEEMTEMEPPVYLLSFSDFDIAADPIRECTQWFDNLEESSNGHGWEEMIHLLEACRLRALRILSRPGYEQAVQKLALAVLMPGGIVADDTANLVRELIE